MLPARLKGELARLEELILAGKDLKEDEKTAAHAEWANEWIKNYDKVDASNIHGIVQDEVGKVFAKVLECAGVYKCTEEGRKHFARFIESL